MAPYKWLPILAMTPVLFRSIWLVAIIPYFTASMFDHYFERFFLWRHRQDRIINMRNEFVSKLSKEKSTSAIMQTKWGGFISSRLWRINLCARMSLRKVLSLRWSTSNSDNTHSISSIATSAKTKKLEFFKPPFSIHICPLSTSYLALGSSPSSNRSSVLSRMISLNSGKTQIVTNTACNFEQT